MHTPRFARRGGASSAPTKPISVYLLRYNDSSSFLKDSLMLSFQDARKLVIQKTTPHVTAHPRPTSKKNLSDALGEALAQEIRSDRDYPPFNRSTRDASAVRASDAPKGATLPCPGEIKAGTTATQPFPPPPTIPPRPPAPGPPSANALALT